MKREVLHHLLLVATVSPDDSITISISPASPSPNEINGVFVLTPVAHGCTAFSMAAKVDTASADKKRDAKPSAGATTAIIQETQEAASEDAMSGRSLRTDQAADILDDVLSLVPTMFKLYDRSAEVDEAALVGFADYFARAKVEPSAGERKLLATADKFNDGKVRCCGGALERAKRAPCSPLHPPPPPTPRSHGNASRTPSRSPCTTSALTLARALSWGRPSGTSMPRPRACSPTCGTT
jgi:hypothetical protein